jgi:hypothetical protein
MREKPIVRLRVAPPKEYVDRGGAVFGFWRDVSLGNTNADLTGWFVGSDKRRPRVTAIGGPAVGGQ